MSPAGELEELGVGPGLAGRGGGAGSRGQNPRQRGQLERRLTDQIGTMAKSHPAREIWLGRDSRDRGRSRDARQRRRGRPGALGSRWSCPGGKPQVGIPGGRLQLGKAHGPGRRRRMTRLWCSPGGLTQRPLGASQSWEGRCEGSEDRRTRTAHLRAPDVHCTDRLRGLRRGLCRRERQVSPPPSLCPGNLSSLRFFLCSRLVQTYILPLSEVFFIYKNSRVGPLG